MCKWFNPRQRNRRGEIEGWGWGDEDIEPLNFRQLESLWPADTSVSIFNEAKYPPCKKWNQLLFIFLTFLVDWHETSNHYLVLISLENLLTLHMYGSDNEDSWNLMDTIYKAESYVTNGFVRRRGFLAKSVTPPHFFRLRPIGRRNAPLIGTSPAYYLHYNVLDLTHILQPTSVPLHWLSNSLNVLDASWVYNSSSKTGPPR